MAAAAVLFSVLFYSLFLPFATVATERFSDAAELAGFFGLVWATITGAAFLVSMLLTNRLFSRFGVAAMVLVLPLLYLGSFGILLAGTGFATIVALRVMTGVWLQGVASPGWETLVNAVPEDRRDQTRTFLNGGPSQVGTAIAGVVALVGQDVLTGRQLAAIGLVASVLTVLAVRAIRRSYGDALAEALLAARPQVFDKPSAWTPIPLDVDAQASEVLTSAMRSSDLRRRRLAFELAAELGTDQLSDALVAGLDDPDPTVRLAAVHGLDVSTVTGREALLRMIDDADPIVGAAAAARALGSDDGSASSRLGRLLGDPDARVRRSAVEQLRAAPSVLAADLAEPLVDDPDPEVRAAALELSRRGRSGSRAEGGAGRHRRPGSGGSPRRGAGARDVWAGRRGARAVRPPGCEDLRRRGRGGTPDPPRRRVGVRRRLRAGGERDGRARSTADRLDPAGRGGSAPA